MEEVMEARKKGSKLIGLKKSQKRKPPAGATRFPLNVRPLPDCFDSDLSEKEDFWGFPLSATKGTVGSDSSIYYSMDQRAKQLFHEEIDNDADFEGFTRKQMQVVFNALLNKVIIVTDWRALFLIVILATT